MISCPFHSPDNHPSCSVNLESGVWICYSRCGGGDWIQFIERVRKDPDYAPIVAAQEASKQSKTPVLKSLLQRGFTRDILLKWGIEWDPKFQAMRLPCLTKTGDLVGNIWRYPEGIVPKYRYQPDFPRNSVLYGLWRLSACVKRLVLVEGPLDAIWVQEAGIAAVAILGSSLSEEQVALIMLAGVQQVVLCFDNDAAGKQAAYRAVPMLRAQGCWVYRTTLPSKYKDVQEAPLEKISQLFKEATLCINGKGIIPPNLRRWQLDNQSPNSRTVWKYG